MNLRTVTVAQIKTPESDCVPPVGWLKSVD
jgi:hypothetical protein